MQKVQATLSQIHNAITVCQFAIQEARKVGDPAKLYQYLAQEYINAHLNGEYEIIP